MAKDRSSKVAKRARKRAHKRRCGKTPPEAREPFCDMSSLPEGPTSKSEDEIAELAIRAMGFRAFVEPEPEEKKMTKPKHKPKQRARKPKKQRTPEVENSLKVVHVTPEFLAMRQLGLM